MNQIMKFQFRLSGLLEINGAHSVFMLFMELDLSFDESTANHLLRYFMKINSILFIKQEG